jgi:hypothetical protein
MILTIGPNGCGFSFLNWTISFLRGDDFYQTLDGVSHAVTSYPFKGATAHNSIKDHMLPNQSKSLLSSCQGHSIVYIVPGSQHDYEYIVSLPGKKIIFDPQINCEKILSRFCMVLGVEHNNFLKFINRLSAKYDNATVKKVMMDCSKMFVEYYQPTPGNKFYMLDYNSMFENLDEHIYKLFHYLEISIDSDRLDEWNEIYKIYKGKNSQNFYEKFLNNQPVIKNQQTAILKEILSWKNGSFPNT